MKERLRQIDGLRGFALMGILLVNVPMMTFLDFEHAQNYEGLNYFLRTLLEVFVQGKFYTIFSFLFGVGAYYFYTSAIRKEMNGKVVFGKRLGFLLLFGLIHVAFIWQGDILVAYAVSGVFLWLAFQKESKRTLRIAKWLMAIYAVLMVVLGLLFLLMPNDTQDLTLPFYNAQGEMNALHNYGDQVFARLEHTVYTLLALPLSFDVIALMLFGYWVAEKGVFERLNDMTSLFRSIVKYGLWASGVMLTLYCILQWQHETGSSQIIVNLSGKTLAPVYVCLILLYYVRLERFMLYLESFGRMAFTNYITQSVITVFGFALLYEDTSHISLSLQVLYAVVFLVCQITFSHWWLKRFKMGPLEWLWRWGTYGKRPTLMKREKTAG